MKYLFLMAILISFATKAGVSSVGRGGGFAEMLVLKVDQQLPTYLKSCSVKPELCHLSPFETESLQNLLSVLRQAQQIPFSFTPACSPHILVSAETVQIPSCLLYVEDPQVGGVPQAISLTKLSLIVLKARVQQTKVAVDPNTFEKIFDRLSLDEQRSVLKVGRQSVILNLIRIGNSYYDFKKSLILETPLESTDLTAELSQVLCDKEALTDVALSVDQIQWRVPNRVYFEGDVNWNCAFSNRNSFKGRLAVTGLMNEKLQLLPGSTRLQVTKKEVVWR